MTLLSDMGRRKLWERTVRLARLVELRAPVPVVRAEVGLVLRAMAAATDPECLDLLLDLPLRALEARAAGLCCECGDALATEHRDGRCLCGTCWLEGAEEGEA